MNYREHLFEEVRFRIAALRAELDRGRDPTSALSQEERLRAAADAAVIAGGADGEAEPLRARSLRLEGPFDLGRALGETMVGISAEDAIRRIASGALQWAEADEGKPLLTCLQWFESSAALDVLLAEARQATGTGSMVCRALAAFHHLDHEPVDRSDLLPPWVLDELGATTAVFLRGSVIGRDLPGIVRAPDKLDVLIRGASADDESVAHLVEWLSIDAMRSSALRALGNTGRRAAADAVLEWLPDEECGAAALDAFSTITGLPIAEPFIVSDDLPDPLAQSIDEEGPPGERLVPDPVAVEAWWTERRERFDPEKRYLGGETWSRERLLDALEFGPMNRREVLSVELALRSRGTLRVETRALPSRQLREIAMARADSTPLLSGSLVKAIDRGLIGGGIARRAPDAVPTRRRSVARTADALAITGFGMVSPLGDGVVESCAAARAGLSNPRGLDVAIHDDETGEARPVTGHAVDLAGFEGLGRMACLGAAALRDAIRRREISDVASSGLFLVLPSGYYLHHAERWSAIEEAETEPAEEKLPLEIDTSSIRAGGRDGHESTVAEVLRARLAQRLVPTMADIAGLQGRFAEHRVFFGDSPAFCVALEAARDALMAGRIEKAVVAGIDSLVWPDVVEALDALGVVKGPDTPAGIMPGEAAALLVLERPAMARSRRAAIHGHVESWAWRTEDAGFLASVPRTGVRLAEVLADAAQPAAKGQQVGLIIGDLNGTAVRAQDWGTALFHVQKLGRVAEAPLWIPALHFGEIGAATGPVACCMAVRGFQRDYAPQGDALVWLWGDGGARGSLLVTPAGSSA